MKLRRIFSNNVPRILNIGIFPDYSMNILRMLQAFLIMDTIVDKAVPDMR